MIKKIEYVYKTGMFKVKHKLNQRTSIVREFDKLYYSGCSTFMYFDSDVITEDEVLIILRSKIMTGINNNIAKLNRKLQQVSTGVLQ